MASRNPQRGAVSVGDRDKRGGWWKWLLLLLLLVAAIVLLVALLSGGDDDEPSGSTTTAPATSTPPAGGSGGEAAPADQGAGSLTADGQSLLPVPSDLSDRVGQRAEGRGVVVQKVEGQQGFWVGESAESRVYVEYGARAGEAEEGASFQPEVGQRVNLEGPIRPAPDEPGRTLGIAGAEEDLVASQGAYVNADSVEAAG